MLISYFNCLRLTFLNYMINVPLVVNKVFNSLKNKSIYDGIIYYGLLSQNTPY